MTAHHTGSAGAAYLVVPAEAVRAAAGSADGLAAFLSRQERQAAVRFRREESRLDYAASHALFRLLAAWRLGLTPHDAAGLAVRRHCAACGSTEHGKPSVEGVELSLSRSHGMVMVAAGPDGEPLGADIEQVPTEIFAGFDDYVLATGERPGPDVAALSDAARIRLWAAKEAVLKAAGLGLSVDPSSVSLVASDAPGVRSPDEAWLEPLRAESSGNPAVHGLLACGVPAPAGYAAAIAARDGLPARSLSLGEIFATKSRA